ncbi:transposase [Roseibacillus persicicus]|uniref:transposase n=1 Tax=Roseibacillus persicicus TaxID=454148 RepID=UPI00398AC8C2
MAQPRWLAPWKDDPHSPAIYHVINRVVDRRFAFGVEEKEKFRMFMRMVEGFSGCQVLSYCVMSNHFHILLEVAPMVRAVRLRDGRVVGLSASLRAQEERAKKLGPGVSPADLPEIGIVLEETEFFQRLKALYSDAAVGEVEKELLRAREAKHWAEVSRIFERFTYRMNDLSQFMKNLLQRFTRWFNRSQDRSGRLWEERFKSVIVQDGTASRTVAAYIDLNPVRAGIVEDPAEYRWSSYGEAMGGGKKARAGLVKALRTSHNQHSKSNVKVSRAARAWAQGGIGKEYRKLLLRASQEVVLNAKVVKKGMSKEKAENEISALEQSTSKSDRVISKVIQHRIRYFSDGVVIGSKDFVDSFFNQTKHRFGSKRTTGARKPRGALSPLKSQLSTVRDFQIP